MIGTRQLVYVIQEGGRPLNILLCHQEMLTMKEYVLNRSAFHPKSFYSRAEATFFCLNFIVIKV
jgi:hypothetical protein